MVKCAIVSFLIFVSGASAQTLVNQNADFEKGLNGWIVYKGPGIQKSGIVELKNSSGAFKSKHVYMRLPANATDNQTQYVKLGQYLQLRKDKKYRYSVDVKWINPKNKLSSAIISIWTKDTKNTFNGKDVWIKDSQKQTLSFDFSPNVDGQVDCYISLLTHQEGFDNTDILIDNFKIEELGAIAVDNDPRPKENLISNGSFNKQLLNWYDTSNNPQKVNGLAKKLNDESLLLELPQASNNTLLNNTWTGVYQSVKLYAGNTYIISAEIDRLVPDKTQYPTIINIFAYKPEENSRKEAWLGSVDYKFNKSEKHIYSQEITPSVTTNYLITARVFGWGNEGRPLKVKVDNISLIRK